MVHEATTPALPTNAFRVTLELSRREPRMDKVLLEAIRAQNRNLALREISRTDFKELFKKKKILIKGQPATPSSSLESGTTHVDILGFGGAPIVPAKT